MKAETLRKSILQYAIQGKLVPQIATEEPASVLLEKIKAEKQELIKQGKIKKEKSLPPIVDDEKPFDIPDTWEWVRFSDIVYFNLGKTPDRKSSRFWNEGIYNWVSIADLKDKKTIFETKEKVSQIAYNEQFSNGLSTVGTLLMSFKLTIGKVSILGCDAFHNEAIISIYPILSDNDVIKMYLFNTLCLIVEFADSTDAIKGRTLNSTKMKNMPFPLPPFEEQERIVTRIEELMVLVDEYEKKEIELSLLEKEFPEKLKKSILQYAIQGKLVPQVETDEPASVLLEKIKIEKQELIKQSKIKKEKRLPPITEDEKPFDIPDSWEWVRLENIVYNNGQKQPNGDFCYIDISSIDNKNQKLSDLENIVKAENAPSRARKIVKRGDIIYATVRPYLHNMCIINKEFSFEPIASTGFAVMSTHTGVYNKYLFYYLLSPEFDLYANDTDNSKGVAYPAINDAKLYRGIVPIPPLAEQQRIVFRIEELLALVDLIASGKKLKKSNTDEVKPIIAAKVVELPIKENKPKFDVASLGMVARADSGVTQDDVNDMLRQVQSFYDKKN
ncbi:restriction endonuclease subunit S [Ruminiclostridium cellobioparum]|uniref:restriction endonuclease subunit S n=1 Tax=Ruminiclostridium cellobioparum TaxID=29355 RepID=UPI0028AC4696|nr:restriction endonuclease subunit S [Ruminiclostridium cellobioparum]